MKTSTLLLLVLIAFGCNSPKKNVPVSIENAECLFSLAFSDSSESDGKEVNMNDCENNLEWEQSGRWNTCKEQGYAYRIEYNAGDSYIINMRYNSAGSGEFTSLILVDIKYDVFKLIETIAGGDRCQLGIVSEDVKFENDNLVYSELITPYHLMSWYNSGLPFDAYADCMVCCIGTAKYQFNPQTRKKEFLNIELLSDKTEENDAFSRTFNSYVKQDKRILNESDIKGFISMVENE